VQARMPGEWIRLEVMAPDHVRYVIVINGRMIPGEIDFSRPRSWYATT
jgi:hypothetical protein